jgi:isopenicillin N synthase-like dioxygenase
LPLETKLKYKFGARSVGYIPAKSTVYVTSIINENTKQDLNETFALATDRPADNALIKDGLRFVGPNPWPTELDEFRPAIAAYQSKIIDLGRKMLPLYALALDQSADFFDHCFKDPISWGRYSYYPPAEAEVNQFGISPHSDHSFITLLPLSDVAGLEVLTQDGRWLPAPVIPGGIIVNTGEFMNRWTNGRFIASPHRVVPPTEDRYSMAVFFNPDHDTIAKPLPNCCGPDNPAKYDPLTLMDYVSWYIDRNYSKEVGGHQDIS